MKKDMRILNILLVVVTIYLFNGCSLVDRADPKLILNIDDDIQFTWQENLTSNDDIINVILTSTDTFECSGMEYSHRLNIGGSNINLQIDGLKAPSICDGDMFEAKSELIVPFKNNLYQLDIEIGESIKNNGTLQKQVDRYTISFPENHGIFVPHKELLRIPDNILWGEITTQGDLENPKNWLTDQLNGLVENVDLEKGYYGHYFLGTEELIVFPESKNQNKYSFIYRLSDSETMLSEIAQSFNVTFQNTATIRCFTSSGKEYR